MPLYRILALASALLAPAAAVASPTFGLQGGVGGSQCTYVAGEPVGTPSTGACTFSINGRTGAIIAPNLAASPIQFLGTTQTVAQLLGATIDAEPIMAAAIAGGNKQVVMPCGTYRFDEPLQISGMVNLRISGQHQGCVHVEENFASGSAFNIVGGSNTIQIDNIEVSPLSGVTRTSGASFHADTSYGVLFEHDQSVLDYTGFELLGGAGQFNYTLNNVSVISATNSGVRLGDTDGTAATQVKDVYLNNLSIGGSAVGLLLQDSSGVYGTNADICCGGGAGVLFAPTSNQNVNSTYLAHFLADEKTGANGGFAFANTGGFVTETYLTDDWGSGSTTGAGLYIGNPNVNGMHVAGFNAHTNAKAGIDIEAGTNIVIDGALATYNNTSNTGLAGIVISGTASHVILSNSISGKGGYVAGAAPSQPNYQSYGFQIGGSASYVDAHDNQTFGNLVGGYLDNSSNSSTNVKTNNLSQ